MKQLLTDVALDLAIEAAFALGTGVALGLSGAGWALSKLETPVLWFDRLTEKLAIPPRASWPKHEISTPELVWRRLRGWIKGAPSDVS